jgi:hypothetical protein
MTSLVRSIGIAAGILVLAGVGTASAQITDPVEFTTTFPFTVGNTLGTGALSGSAGYPRPSSTTKV